MPRNNPEQEKAPASRTMRRIRLHLILLAVFWLLIAFAVIPWYKSGRIPADSYPLIEGERAYIALIRQERPTLAVTLRGLNLIKAKYTVTRSDEGRTVAVGNVRITFSQSGEFFGISLLEAPEN